MPRRNDPGTGDDPAPDGRPKQRRLFPDDRGAAALGGPVPRSCDHARPCPPPIGRREDVLSLLLIENLQREDLNPIDMAKGLRSLFQARQGDVSLDEILNVLQTHERDRNRLP